MARIHSYSKGIKKFFSMYEEKFELISFMMGMGGAIVYRILAHNEKYYWEEEFSCIESLIFWIDPSHIITLYRIKETI